jgi:hypothetical protein
MYIFPRHVPHRLRSEGSFVDNKKVLGANLTKIDGKGSTCGPGKMRAGGSQ